MRGFGRVGYVSAIAAVLALAVGGSAAFGADVTATASALTKKQIQKLIASYVRNHPGPRGPAGAPGAPGAAGKNGANGVKGDKGDKGDPGAGVPEVFKFNRRTSFGTGNVPLYTAHGLSIEANCVSPTTSTFYLRSIGGGNTYHLFEVDNNNAVYHSGSAAAPANAVAVNLAGAGVFPLSGKVEWAGNDGTELTINYMIAFNTQQGDCVFAGSIM